MQNRNKVVTTLKLVCSGTTKPTPGRRQFLTKWGKERQRARINYGNLSNPSLWTLILTCYKNDQSHVNNYKRIPPKLTFKFLQGS